MKRWQIDIRTIKAMANANGTIRAQVDATVQPAPGAEAGAPTTILEFDEDTARVLVLLLKTQLAEFDARKAKSRRG